MKQRLFWKNPGYKKRPSLKKNIECDYLIVGGGITGVTLAYFLGRRGKDVVLIERGLVGSGATGRSAGILTLKGELGLVEILNRFGKKRGLQYWRMNHEILKLVKQIIRKERMKCDFEPLTTIFASLNYGDEASRLWVRMEYEAEKRIEPQSRYFEGDKVGYKLNTRILSNALFSRHHTISVNPLKHVQVLSKVIEKYGVKVYENTPLRAFPEKNVARTPRGKITFKKIILATDNALPISAIVGDESTVIVTKPLTRNQVDETLLAGKTLWDSEDEYHYLKLTKDRRILVGFGDKKIKRRRAKPRIPHHHVSELYQFVKELFPYLDLKIDYTWSGIYGRTKSGLPVIKQKGNKISVGGAGTQLESVMAAKHVADKLLGKPSKLDDFYPSITPWVLI